MFLLGSVKIGDVTIDNCLIVGVLANSYLFDYGVLYLTPRGDEGFTRWNNVVTPTLRLQEFKVKHSDDYEYKIKVKVTNQGNEYGI